MPSRTAEILAGQPRSRSASEDEVQFGINPIDELGLMVNAQTYTPEQAAENRRRTLWELLSMTPGPGNAIAANDAYIGAGDAYNAFNAGDYKGGTLASALAGLSGAGAVFGLPFGKMAKGAADAGADTLHIFAGPTAKTADHAALAEAQDMAQSGASRDDIWRDTGWFQGVDGKWRFEIDDSALSVMAPKNKMSGDFSSYEKALVHPDLYEAYPAMKRNRVTFDHRESDSGIQLTANPNGLNGKPYDMSLGTKGRQWEGKITKPNVVREHATHELQHNVSAREGFAPGDNPQAIFDEIMEQNPGMSPEVATEMAIDQYRRTMDEVYARNAATRLNMSAADRRAKAPWLTQDVPDDQQIVRYR